MSSSKLAVASRGRTDGGPVCVGDWMGNGTGRLQGFGDHECGGGGGGGIEKRDDWQGRAGKGREGRLLGGRLEFLGPGKHQVVTKGTTFHPSFIPCFLFASIPFHESGPTARGIHSLLYFAYTYVRLGPIYLGWGVIYLAE